MIANGLKATTLPSDNTSVAGSAAYGRSEATGATLVMKGSGTEALERGWFGRRA